MEQINGLAVFKAIKILEERLAHLSIDDHPSLFSAKGGIALFYLYFGNYTEDPLHKEKAHTLIDDCMQGVFHCANDPSLADGFTGFLWLIQHVVKKGFLEVVSEEFLCPIESCLLQSIERDIAEKNYDLLYGLVGKGLYFLEKSEGNHQSVLSDIVNALYEMAIPLKAGISWQDHFTTREDNTKNNEVYNLGLSHGIPSIIIFLTKVYRKNIARNKCRKMITQAVKWLLCQENPYQYSCFPNNAGEKGASRLGWSYGDLGIALALIVAGKTLGSQKWYEKGIQIADFAASRDLVNAHTYQDHDGISDAGFCNGTAGIASVFNIIYQVTLIPKFSEVSIQWLQITLKSIHQIEFKPKMSTNNGFILWYNDPGLIKGLSGVGLVLLSFLDKSCFGWDRLFLTDFNPETQTEQQVSDIFTLNQE